MGGITVLLFLAGESPLSFSQTKQCNIHVCNVTGTVAYFSKRVILSFVHLGQY